MLDLVKKGRISFSTKSLAYQKPGPIWNLSLFKDVFEMQITNKNYFLAMAFGSNHLGFFLIIVVRKLFIFTHFDSHFLIEQLKYILCKRQIVYKGMDNELNIAVTHKSTKQNWLLI